MKILLIFCILFISCHPIKKALRVARQNPKDFAGFCAEVYPVKDSVTVKDSVHFDTLYKEGVPIIQTEIINDTVFKTVFFPGTTQFVTKIIRHDSVIIRRDFAKETELNNKIDNLIVSNKDIIGQRERLKNGRDKWRIIALCALSFIALQLVWKFWLSKYIKIFK